MGPSTLDPHKNAQTAGGDPYLLPIYDRLTRLDDTFELQPMLAESWEFAPDGSTLTFHLHDDATFTDGSPVDATAVKANIDRARTLEGGVHVQTLAAITDVTVADPTTVVIALAKGNGAQLPVLFAGNGGMIINPKAFADPKADLTTSIGTGNESGPWIVTSFEPGPGGKVTYERRPDIADYWDKDAGKIAKLEWLNIPTAAQRINAVRAGDITMGQVTGVDVQQAKQLVDSGEQAGQFFRQPLIPQQLWLQASRPPLDNLELRQAIQLAIPKDTITQGLFSGNCTVTNQDYPEGTHWASSATVAKAPQYDPDKAKQLLAESGVDPTFKLYASETWKAQGQAVQQALNDVGMKVTLEVDPRTPGGPTFANGDFDSQQGAFVSSPDPSQLLTDLYFGGVGLVPEADRVPYADLIAQLSDPVNDQDERAAIFDKIAEQLYAGAYSVPLCYGSQVWLQTGAIGNLDDMWGTGLGLVDVRYLYMKAS